MNEIKIKEIISDCLLELYRNDSALIINDVSERAITHKLAEYIQKRIPAYHVDCEYNRNFELGPQKPKKIKLLEIAAQEESEALRKSGDPKKVKSIKEVSTYPDIIVHTRLTNRNNLLIIEVKKDNSQVSFEFDQKKLNAFTGKDTEKRYLFKFGLFIEIPIGKKLSEPKLTWYGI